MLERKTIGCVELEEIVGDNSHLETVCSLDKPFKEVMCNRTSAQTIENEGNSARRVKQDLNRQDLMRDKKTLKF